MANATRLCSFSLVCVDVHLRFFLYFFSFVAVKNMHHVKYAILARFVFFFFFDRQYVGS